jgi:hypothetical protein
LLPFLLIVAGICFTILSFRSEKKTIPLTEVSGSLRDHTSSDKRGNFFDPHYFWLRGYQCTFIIPASRSSDLDESVFQRSFQDTSILYAKIPVSRKDDLQKMGSVIPVLSLSSDENIFLEEKNSEYNYHFNPLLLFTGICFVLAAVILLIIFLIKEVRSF